jgi:hypothetical protein
MAENRKMESSEQGNNWKRKNAEKMAEKQKLETPEQHRKRIEKMLEYSQSQKNGNNRKNLINGISLLNEFKDEILENEKGIHVPMITKYIEIENSVKKAFEHIMKTNIGQDETIPDNLLQVIHQSISTEQNGRNIEIPLYQLHQANVCVICDRFITGTADLNWIKKNTLIQHKARLTIPDINSELQKCYQVSDPDLHELLLSPRARFKKNGEYLCCTQCERALQNDRLDKNPPKYAIAVQSQ